MALVSNVWASAGPVVRTHREMRRLRKLRSRDSVWEQQEQLVFGLLEELKGIPCPSGTIDHEPVLVAAACSERVLVAALAVWFPDIGLGSPALGPGWLSFVDDDGRTPLFESARWGCCSVFAFLFGDLCDRRGATWVAHCCLEQLMRHACSTEVCALLEDARVDMDPLALVQDSCAIACLIVREAGMDAVIGLGAITGDGAMLAEAAAAEGMVSVLETVQSLLEPCQWQAWVQACRFSSATHDDLCVPGFPRVKLVWSALVLAASKCNVCMVKWLLDAARWPHEHVACAMFCAADAVHGPPAGAPDILEHLVHHWRSLPKEAVEDRVLLIVRCALSKVLGWWHGQPFDKNLVQLLASCTSRGPRPSVLSRGPWSALGCAVRSGRVDAVAFVIDKHPGLLLEVVGEKDSAVTPFMLAAREESFDVFEAVASALARAPAAEFAAAVWALDARGQNVADHAANNVRLQNLDALLRWFPMGKASTERLFAAKKVGTFLCLLPRAIRLHLHRVVRELVAVCKDELLEVCKTADGTVLRLTCMELSVLTGKVPLFFIVQQALDAHLRTHPRLDRACTVYLACVQLSRQLGVADMMAAVLRAARVFWARFHVRMDSAKAAELKHALDSAKAAELKHALESDSAAVPAFIGPGGAGKVVLVAAPRVGTASGYPCVPCLIHFSVEEAMVDQYLDLRYARAFGYSTPDRLELMKTVLWTCVNCNVTVHCTSASFVAHLELAQFEFAGMLYRALNACAAEDGWQAKTGLVAVVNHVVVSHAVANLADSGRDEPGAEPSVYGDVCLSVTLEQGPRGSLGEDSHSTVSPHVYVTVFELQEGQLSVWKGRAVAEAVDPALHQHFGALSSTPLQFLMVSKLDMPFVVRGVPAATVASRFSSLAWVRGTCVAKANPVFVLVCSETFQEGACELVDLWLKVIGVSVQGTSTCCVH